MPRITPDHDREIVAPLAAALAVVGVQELRHPLLPDAVATLAPTGAVEPTPALDALPAALRQAERAREAERTMRAIGLVLAGIACPLVGAFAGRAALPLVALPTTFGLVVGGVGGAAVGWRAVAARLNGLLDPARATAGAAKRLADEALRARALEAWRADGPLTTAAIATAQRALAERPAGDDPEDWEALRDALAVAEVDVARARSRVGARVARSPAAPAVPEDPHAPVRGESGREVVPPEPPALSDERKALIDALQARMPTRPPKGAAAR